MKVRHHLFVLVLILATTTPTLAACMGDLLQLYLKPGGPVTRGSMLAPGAALGGSQLALVKIVAVYPDVQPHDRPDLPGWHWKETGTLKLSKIESTGNSLPTTFVVPYNKRSSEGMDCETWDFIVPKPGKRLLAFFRLRNKGWEIPELSAGGVVSDVSRMRPALRAQAQRLFRSRL